MGRVSPRCCRLHARPSVPRAGDARRWVKLTATALHRWTHLAISIPAALVPLEVWYDAERARVGSSGLYRLEPVAGQSVGRWAPVTLPTGFGDAGFQGGRAHAAGNTLYVFTRAGDAASWASSSCP